MRPPLSRYFFYKPRPFVRASAASCVFFWNGVNKMKILLWNNQSAGREAFQ